MPASTIYVPRQGTIPSPCPNCKTTPVAPLEQDIIFTQQELDCTLHLIALLGQGVSAGGFPLFGTRNKGKQLALRQYHAPSGVDDESDYVNDW